ncbi:MAG: cytochrome c maturation protein CcmE [Deltaproteobacteria bacterium]|nr:cytochrome c maturation protein CcmE [Deltaproteobacteria bacterium]
MNKPLKYILGGALVIAVAIAVFTSISSENLTYYHTPGEVLSNPDKFQKEKIRVMGLVVKDSVEWEPKGTKLNFRITEDSKQFLNVSYVGAKPDMFKEGQGVVIEGVMASNENFVASELLVKHSEEYKTDDHTKNKSSYSESLKM